MHKFEISTDSTSDFYDSEIKQYNLYVGKLDFIMTDKNGKITERKDDFKNTQEYIDFYNDLSNGIVAKTSILNLQAHIDLFRKMAQDGIKNAIHISQGMGLSPTVINARKAIQEVKLEFPDINYVAIDSNTTTVQEGNLVRIAMKLRDNEKSMQETVDLLEKFKMQTQHFIVVDDLMYLKRGGRISAFSATVGTLLQLKPIIEFTKEGKLEVIRKENGIKKAYKSVIEEIKRDYTFHKEFGNAIIVHTNNPNGAKLMSDMFYEVFGIMPEIRIMGPIIGAHVGPNAVAITFLSNEQRKYSSNK